MLKSKLLPLILVLGAASSAWAATFGTVVSLTGHISDIALDNRRGVVYAANFTANRIEVVSMWDLTTRAPYTVPPQPGSISLSPDGRYLVVTHYARWRGGDGTILPGITILDLDAGTRRTITNGVTPLTVAFGGGSQALVVSTEGFLLLDPATGVTQTLAPKEMGGLELPAPLASYPLDIVQASLGVSGDSRYIVGVASSEEQDLQRTVNFRYDVQTREVFITGVKASPPLGPRLVSVDEHGLSQLVGWALFDYRTVLLAQFPHAKGELSIGTHVIDWARSLVYAQVPESTAPEGVIAPPVLHVLDSDNLTVRERIRLPENLAGRSLLNPDHSVMYSVSASGLTVLPVGDLYKMPRVMAAKEDVLFRGSFCDRRTMTQELDIIDAGGGSVDFRLSTSMPGLTLSQASGTTPARVTLYLDANTYQNLRGTATGVIEITSRAGVGVPPPVRILVNAREPDQRGALVNVPGKLVDILADPVRDRFYVIRQDKNQVLVFNATSFQQVGVLRTGNTPTQLAISTDRRFLFVGNDNSQIVNVHDLDTLEQMEPIAFPGGHYPRSIAVSKNAVLAAVRSVSPGLGCPEGYGLHTIDRIDFTTNWARTLPSLGVYCNDIPLGTMLLSTPSHEHIYAAMEDGGVLLYEAEADTFVVSRKDFGEMKGAFAALSDQAYVLDNNLLNRSLVAYGALETGSGQSSGFTIHDGMGLRTTAPAITAPGIIQRVNLTDWQSVLGPVKMIEAPLLAGSMETPPVGQIGQAIMPFTRTLIVTPNRNSFISLSVSGLVVLPWDFDAWVAKPVIQSVVNLADGTAAIAPGGLVAVRGANLSLVTLANNELPVPTTLGEACLTFNTSKAPLLLVSPRQINAQVPFEVSGNVNVVLRTVGGASDPFPVVVSPTAPAVFQTATAGPDKGLATLYRTVNNEPVTLSNPIHPEDYLVIYVTGLGKTSPAVATGAPAPGDPLAHATIVPAVKLGGVALPVLYAGLVPGQVGVYQINVFVPPEVPRGMDVALVIARPGGDLSLSVRVVK
ncbi:MAG: hypothetical protein IT159_10525 [Bryobacterales bacterium]|nr:hypothetical protein [Bryobacterales bacterium]